MKMIHSMVRVCNLEKSLWFYREALCLEVADRFDFEGFTLAYLRNETTGFELELTHNHGQDTPYDLGDGYGHIALSVDDLDSEHKRLCALELASPPTPIKEFFRDGGLMARFFFIQDPDGYKIEVLQRHGRYQ